MLIKKENNREKKISVPGTLGVVCGLFSISELE